MVYDFVIIGGGIVGLAVAMALLEEKPAAKIAVLEKELQLAVHQTGRNSGVIHSGIYYKPGSMKAKLAKMGNDAMVNFCEQHGIPYERCGKVIVATDEKETLLLNQLFQRGLENGLPIRKLCSEELQEREPYIKGMEAILVPTAGIVDYRAVCEKMADIIRSKGGDIFLGCQVKKIADNPNEMAAETANKTFYGKYLINCAGLQSDRVAKMASLYADVKIVPFRGEYYQLKEDKRHMVKHLIYPVPNPDFPFLGVHFTRMVDGSVDVGPNAVLSFKREGYKKTDFAWKDFLETMTYPGFWKLAGRYTKEGLQEMIRSYRKKLFVQNVQRFMPEIQENDLIPGPAGVRAQALRHDGTLVDDFYLLSTSRMTHVLNAPSPAATASIEIGKEIVGQIKKRHVS